MISAPQEHRKKPVTPSNGAAGLFSSVWILFARQRRLLYRGSFGHELLKTKDDLYLSNVIGKAILLDEIKSRKETIKFLKDEKNKYPEDKELKEFVKEVYEYGPLGESHLYEEY